MSEFDAQLKAIEKIAAEKVEAAQAQLDMAKAALEAIRLVIGTTPAPKSWGPTAPKMVIGPEKFVQHRTRMRELNHRPAHMRNRRGCPPGSIIPAILQALTDGPGDVREIDKRIRAKHPEWRPSHSIYDQRLLLLTRQELVRRWHDKTNGCAFVYELTEKGLDAVTAPQGDYGGSA